MDSMSGTDISRGGGFPGRVPCPYQPLNPGPIGEAVMGPSSVITLIDKWGFERCPPPIPLDRVVGSLVPFPHSYP